MTPEIEHYLQFFTDYHRQLDELIKDLPLEAFNWRPLTNEEGADDHAINSLAVLLTSAVLGCLLAHGTLVWSPSASAYTDSK